MTIDKHFNNLYYTLKSSGLITNVYDEYSYEELLKDLDKNKIARLYDEKAPNSNMHLFNTALGIIAELNDNHYQNQILNDALF